MATSMAATTRCPATLSSCSSRTCSRPSRSTVGVRRCVRLSVRAAEVTTSSAADASSDSVVAEVASLPEAPATRKPSPLEKGGTLAGKNAAGKDPASATLGATKLSAASGEKFSDPRWINGTWDLEQFSKDEKVDWDAVIDAEVVRRQWLEENPQSSNNDDPVLFETSNIPWWAWVRRFHLPEAEKLNGRAAMVGFFMAYIVDGATGVGLVDQMGGFLGKLLLFITVVGVLLVRKNEDVSTIKGLIDESTLYDRQWQAAWKEGPPPPSKEE